MFKYIGLLNNFVIGVVELSQDFFEYPPDQNGNEITTLKREASLEVVPGMEYDTITDTFAFPWDKEITNIDKKRKAYATMTHKEDGSILIPYGGVAYTVDYAEEIIPKYALEDPVNGTNKAQELIELMVAGKNYIRSIYP